MSAIFGMGWNHVRRVELGFCDNPHSDKSRYQVVQYVFSLWKFLAQAMGWKGLFSFDFSGFPTLNHTIISILGDIRFFLSGAELISLTWRISWQKYLFQSTYCVVITLLLEKNKYILRRLHRHTYTHTYTHLLLIICLYKSMIFIVLVVVPITSTHFIAHMGPQHTQHTQSKRSAHRI